MRADPQTLEFVEGAMQRYNALLAQWPSLWHLLNSAAPDEQYAAQIDKVALAVRAAQDQRSELLGHVASLEEFQRTEPEATDPAQVANSVDETTSVWPASAAILIFLALFLAAGRHTRQH